MLALLTAILTATVSPGPAAPPPPVVATTPADPAKLAVATRIAARLIPDGTYHNMMDQLLGNMQQGMIASATTLPVRELAKAAGVPDAKLTGMSQATVHDVLAILDPAFDERMRLTTTAMTRVMIEAMSGMEPFMREGMAAAYANHFTLAQLTDIETFFSSPTGSRYAAENLKLLNDPAFQGRMRDMTKSMTTRMPAAIAAAAAAAKDLPKPRTYAELTPADKTKLATLLGVDPATMK